MSLINDALKKAQRQREAAAPSPADAPKVDASAPVQGSHVARIARRRQPIPARTLMLLVTGGVLLAVTAAAIAVVLLNLDTIPPAPIRHAAARRPAPPAAPAPVAVSMPLAGPAAGEASTLPHASASTPAAPAAAPVKPAAPVIAVTSFLSSLGTPAPTLPPGPAPRAAPPLSVVLPVVNPAANAFLDAASVTGVRTDGADSKIILNNRVVRIGDIVDPATGLRLSQVTASNLVFTDANGLKYEKSLR